MKPDDFVRARARRARRVFGGAGVEVTALLPCYSPANVDRQRGDGVFDRSISGLRALNGLGYGQYGTDLVLNLIYNPQGACRPPP